MVNESEEALNIIEDMMEEQIINTEVADLKTRAMVSSLQLLRGQVRSDILHQLGMKNTKWFPPLSGEKCSILCVNLLTFFTTGPIKSTK